MAQANLIVDPGVPEHPRRLGALSLRARLARGGMADILLAIDESERAVVVKRVRADLAATPRAKQLARLLVAEAHLTESLRHPNIVRVLGHGRDEAGAPHIVLEYVEGLDLHALLASASRRGIDFPLELRLAVLCGVLRALDYAHRARDERGAPFQIVHRDVSPANVLIGFEGAVKLCDFGIASATVMPQAGESVEGKASYMSPEHARGETVGPRADIYACGILLWELLSGRRMRGRGDDRFEQAARGDLPPLALRGLPDEQRLRDIVWRALAVDPENRHPSAGAMMRELERWCRENDFLAGESELGRFVRARFADRRSELIALIDDGRESVQAIREHDRTPTRSGPRPRRASAPTPGLPSLARKPQWRGALIVGLASLLLTLALLAVALGTH